MFCSRLVTDTAGMRQRLMFMETVVLVAALSCASPYVGGEKAAPPTGTTVVHTADVTDASQGGQCDSEGAPR
jgi:hypothetical protein